MVKVGRFVPAIELALFTLLLMVLISFCGHMRPARAEGPKAPIPITVADKDAKELISSASEAEQLRSMAQVAQEAATAAQKVADGYATRAALARKNYDSLYYKLVGDLKIDTAVYELQRKGDALIFTLKETKGEKTPVPNPSP